MTAASPAAATQDTTLDVQISGSGFDAGSTAEWLLGGASDPRVKTNSTRFVSSTSLVANISIARDAIPTSYDIGVTTSSGKKGIGTEKFKVLAMEQLAAPSGASFANDVNSSGVIAGEIAGGCDGHGVPAFWSNPRAVSPLPLVAGLCRGGATLINDAGTILGKLYPAGSTIPTHIRWTPDGNGGYTAAVMGTIPGNDGSDVTALNDAGHAVGYDFDGSRSISYWWSESTGFVPLRPPPGATGCFVNVINNSDQIGGGCYVNALESGTIWNSPTSVPVTLPRLPDYDYVHDVRALNNVGVAAGTAWKTLKGGKLLVSAVRYVKTGSAWTIELMPGLGGDSNKPSEVNDAGWITGSAKISSGQEHAFLWKPGSGIKDLGSFGSESYAWALTPVGAPETLVVGISDVGSTKRAFLWRPQ